MTTPAFVIFHQPKTAGSYAHAVLPKGYVLGHYNNYHYCLKRNMLSEQTKLVCIVRCPLDYYISVITFWCLDPKYCKEIRTKSMTVLQEEYTHNKTNEIGHPNYWMSRGFTERDLHVILSNLFCEEFLLEHEGKLSKKHHTYDNYVFSTMLRLDIGFYTFAFLCQYSRKKASEIQTSEECRTELIYIHDNFIILNQKFMTEELKALCVQYNVPFNDKEGKKMSSNRKRVSDYNFSNELIEKIKYKDRYMIEIFNLELF
tara:strand:+ start:155 stop:928 length:774 start_codon:yes stop_codon:yes gene_type:complete